ncbi:MAG: hypothetical protein A3H32_16510 [Betaproteobacteria bacterium RIFCSPLOWO2_02_FULL_63_19]|nr:MAG: hypothetical protein A3H32_16510 [Betaproteobacteria bacterium RIFCSPLOWO2_02_FULL_63_19]
MIYGYAGKIAKIDLSSGAVIEVPTQGYAASFIGGQGMASRLYWEDVPPDIHAFDPENRLIFATGPCAGFQGLSGARWVVCGKSPATSPHYFTHSNLGGSWGVELKAAGFDGLLVNGRAETPVCILIEDGAVRIESASGLWGKGAVQARQILKSRHGSSHRVVAIGPAGENMTALATLQADNDSSGSGALGGVMGSKRLKAIIVRGTGRVPAARPAQLQELLEHIAALRKDFPRTDTGAGRGGTTDHCAGCTDECTRGLYVAADGSKGKFMCQSAASYKEWAEKYYGKPTDVPFFANRLADDCGISTKAVAPMVAWLDRCYRAGVLKDSDVGLPLSKIGSLEFMQVLLENVAHRQGFGELLSEGVHRAAASIGGRAEELLKDAVTGAGEQMSYVPKAYLTTGLLYALNPRQPIQQLHEVSRLGMQWVQWANGVPNANLSSTALRAIAGRFWGSEIAADFSTYEGKALAAKMVQDRQLAKDCLILCDNVWPLTYVEHSDDHVGDPTLESQVFSAITGRDMSEEGLYRVGERVFNLQRAITSREGRRGRLDDTLPESCFTVPLENERLNPGCIFPGKNGETISRKGALFEKDKFFAMRDEYYGLRGWDRETGLQTQAGLEGQGLSDVAVDLAKRVMLARPREANAE